MLEVVLSLAKFSSYNCYYSSEYEIFQGTDP